jgi:NADH-quinone oxidoreductase subunit I
MEKSGVSPAICAQWRAPSTASRCRRPSGKTTYAIQLTPDFEICEYDRNNLVYEKEHLLIDGPGKYPDYSFWQVSGKAIAGKDKGDARKENPPEDVRSLLP